MLKTNQKSKKIVGAAISRPNFEGISKKEKGITLIALIITIVVMLILVAVTLDITIGENGIVSKAKTASEETRKMMEQEELLIAVIGTMGRDGKVDFRSLDNNLPEGFTGSNGSYTSKNGNQFTISENGEVEYKDSAEENTEESILEGKYYTDPDTAEYIEIDLENNTFTLYYRDGEELIPDQYIIAEVDETNQQMKIIMTDGEDSFEANMPYEFIEINGDIVNVILFNIDNDLLGWKNMGKNEIVLDGTYVNSTGDYRLVFDKEKLTVGKQYFSGGEWSYGSGDKPTFYVIIDGNIHIGTDSNMCEISDDLEVITIGEETYTKQAT